MNYDEYKKEFKKQVDAVGYLTILTNIAWQLILAREDIEKIKKTLEFQNA